jgi:Zn-dependent M28 family amino/carboxypeptidase
MQLIHSKDFAAAAGDDQVRRFIENISQDDMRGWVEHLARPRHAAAEPAQNRATADWLSQTLGSAGYEVQFQGQSRNLIASPKNCPVGTARILIGAHYDSVPASPGADDNGSALAALLGCACALAETPHRAMFVAFNREEDGFIGSREFVDDFVASTSTNIACAHILEMVGYASDAEGSQHLPSGLPIQLPSTGNFLGLLANAQSAAAMKKVVESAATFTGRLPVTGLTVIAGAEKAFPVLARSDHIPFWASQIPAIMWTDTAEFRNPNYHRPSDTPDTLNYSFLRAVTQLLTAAIAVDMVEK